MWLQVKDHILALRANEREVFKKLDVRLLWMILSLESGPYSRCMLLSMLTELYWNQNNFPIADILQNDVRTANEERGEITLSILARMVVGDPERGKHSKLSDMYSLISYCRALCHQLDKDMNVTPPTSKHYKIRDNAPEIPKIVTFFKQTLHQIRNNTWKCYSRTPNRKYPASTPLVTPTPTPRYLHQHPATAIKELHANILGLLTDDNYSFGEFLHPETLEAGLVAVPQEEDYFDDTVIGMMEVLDGSYPIPGVVGMEEVDEADFPDPCCILVVCSGGLFICCVLFRAL